MDCIFCKITEGEIPSHAIWEDAHHLAFLDVNPIQDGHTLVIPKHHDSNLFELNNNDYKNLLTAAKIVRGKLKSSTGAKRIAMVVEGLEIDHVHIHLIPINKPEDINPTNAAPADQDHLKQTAEKIRKQT
jgi:histidine triad (HIT) family protein